MSESKPDSEDYNPPSSIDNDEVVDAAPTAVNQRQRLLAKRSGTVRLDDIPALTIFREGTNKNKQPFRAADFCKLNSGKFLCSVEKAFRYFINKEPDKDLEKFAKEKEPDAVPEEESKSVDLVEYTNMKRELADIRKELVLRDKQVMELRKTMLKMECTTEYLKHKVQNPMDVRCVTKMIVQHRSRRNIRIR